MSPALIMSMPPRLGGYWVTALSLAAQAWPASNEAPRPVTQPGALIALLWLFCSIFLSFPKQLTQVRALMSLG